MSQVLVWCWKEWRSQRGLLGSYAFLVFASLCCVFFMVPQESWQRSGSAHVLGWFFASGMIGVLLFAVPQLVRSEYGVKEDTFVRRLPGALLPSFLGKLLFLLLVAAALPLIGLAMGELLLAAMGRSWNEMFVETGNAYSDVRVDWPDTMVYAACAMPFAPWVWVLATWLPDARMAVGGTAVFALALGLGILTVMSQCPGIERTLAPSWQASACVAVASGLLVAGLSWTRGRRGGDHRRSARIGLAWFASGLVVLAAWIGSWACRYYHPDLRRLAYVQVEGLSPDGRFAIGRGNERGEWLGMPLRLDLEQGTAEQLGGLGPELQRPFLNWTGGRQRFWHLAQVGVHEVLDLATGERRSADYDRWTRAVALPADLRAPVDADRLAQWPFRLPGGLRANVVGNELVLERPDGSLRHQAWPQEWRNATLREAGHGVIIWGSGRELYDLTRLQVIKAPGLRDPEGFGVRGVWLLAVGGIGQEWRRFDPDHGVIEPCPELKGCEVHGLFDDDRLLCQRRRKNAGEVFLYRPADRAIHQLRLPEHARRTDWQLLSLNPYISTHGCVDRFGRIWMCDSACSPSPIACARVDPATLSVDLRGVPLLHDSQRWGSVDLLDTPDERSVLVREGGQIVRLDMVTGERTVLFPRPR
jgi:hypothetical protein